ncbi:ABC transporter substrate-binding protein [Nocardioides sp. cx-169]|uniref:ABC transporter substrate-binding protein n=1 Tax=Nocardioides sp. cx-169 TaxID=2899080 RepID=UPI001E2A3ECF|nr:ABC transporter substrate-binding protein [Nocardioides sp. cx-169]MCD4533074.1 ABC transporter substrate-binding protein [Nocardioides sp. cx-169]
MTKRTFCAGAVMALVLTACGGGGGENPSDIKVDDDAGVGVELADATWETDVDRDATVKFATSLYMGSADAHAAGATVSTHYFNLLYDRLFWASANGELRGYLVKDWEFVADGLSLTLRDDATFHDGSPLDAAAVKANLDRARTAEFSAYQEALKNVTDVEVVDDYTVLVKTEPKTGATLPYVLAGWAGMIMNPKFTEDSEVLRTSAPDGVGSGPYKITSWTPGEDTVLFERVDGHWDPAAGLAAKIEVKAITDPTQAMNAVATGQYDVFPFSSEAAIQALDKAKADPENLQTSELIPSGSIVGLWMRDLVDPTVREAITLAVDRDALVSQYAGGAVPINQLFAEGHPAHTDAVDEYTKTDPARASELVKEAPQGATSLTMAYVETGLDTRVAQLVQSQLKSVGIELELKPMTHASIYQAWFQNQFEMVLMGNAGPNHASTGIYASLLRGGTSWGAPDSAIESIEAELLRAEDPAMGETERQEVYQGILAEAAKEHWILPFAQLRNLTFASARVVNIQPAVPFQYQSLGDYRYLGVKAD